ncbi:hypothetical protein KPZU09_18400 [Klebsiella pneumoniae]|uniref:Aminotransferase class I/classII large domain-containing protein n=1 Tax=Klebsiella pneumoniae TaxID=573 RepID=A0A919HP37_KLEPN|nr:hypothetical protein KPZU09_18400 [Klebsiella pneumoniae]
MPDFTASPLVDALEENLFSLLEKLAAEVNTEALPLIDLSSGSPDQPTPPEVIDSLQSAIHRRENHGYPSFWGKPQVREAIARFYRRQYDVELDPHSEVAVFQGSHIGIGGIPRALLSPGNTSSPPIPAIRFTARRRCSPRRRFMACRSGRRTISCRILTIFPGKSLTRPGWWCLTIRIIQPAPSLRRRCSPARCSLLVVTGADPP